MAIKLLIINKKAIKWAAMIFILTSFIKAGVRDPFPIGAAMMSQGALTESQGILGREPWSAAAIYRDTIPWGAAFSAVSYHGADGAGGVSQYAAGGFASFGNIICKTALMQLDAMGVYYERTAYLSAGMIYKFLSLSTETKTHRVGLKANSSDVRTMTSLGSTLHIQVRRISASVMAEGLTVSTSGSSDVDPPLSFSGRICTVRNRYGSQGVMVKVTPENDKPVRFIVAQEYRLSKNFAIGASLGSNPSIIGFGLIADIQPAGSGAAVVNHPLLGWSKGFYADYTGTRHASALRRTQLHAGP
ncbi:MAG: hypothetical protein FWE57_05910 [Chitinispirillia bacterium]|nr:hypothetical protein [Chitinispirillia bacterium]